MKLQVCFVGGARYNQPLDTTSEKKFRVLTELGRIFVIGFSTDARTRFFTQHAHFYLLPCLAIPVLRYLLMFTVGLLLVLWCILRHGVRILVAQSPYEAFAAAWAKMLGRLLGKRVVLIVESHGDFEVSLFLQRRVLSPRLYRFLMRHAAGFGLKNADLLRSISDSTEQQLMRWVPDKPVIRFAAWTDIDAFSRIRTEKDEHPLQNILFAGVLIPRKGVHHLVSAFAIIAEEFPQACLAIVGGEENKAYARDLKARVNQVGLNGRVQFAGEVPQAELATWMRQACVFVLPSLSEGLPRVVVEAMATGTLVLGTRVGGIPEMVRDGETGFLVPPGDEEALAERLRWVLEHPREVQEMGHRACAFAERLFSTEAYVQGYGQIFETAQSLLNGRKPHDASRAF